MTAGAGFLTAGAGAKIAGVCTASGPLFFRPVHCVKIGTPCVHVSEHSATMKGDRLIYIITVIDNFRLHDN